LESSRVDFDAKRGQDVPPFGIGLQRLEEEKRFFLLPHLRQLFTDLSDGAETREVRLNGWNGGFEFLDHGLEGNGAEASHSERDVNVTIGDDLSSEEHHGREEGLSGKGGGKEI
jgi:hypothetical protein